jgi:hypothetical protein
MRYLALILFLMMGCGQDHIVDKPTPVPIQNPQPNPDSGPGQTVSYQKVSAYLNTYCSQCHSSAAFMTSELALRGSGAKNQLASKRMPPANAGKVLPDNVRTEILGFLASAGLRHTAD